MTMDDNMTMDDMNMNMDMGSMSMVMTFGDFSDYKLKSIYNIFLYFI